MAVAAGIDICGRRAVVARRKVCSGSNNCGLVMRTMAGRQGIAGLVTVIAGQRTNGTPGRAGAAAVAVSGRTRFGCGRSRGRLRTRLA